ncbi:hypothetical protein EW145_g8072 [Phellinidium pouzarii]|uniref:3,4-dihydroxy-2-butanone-4-phosphate synthase n=1 Tax=Phellinidium pouzarii TaxID=167371 RepID=A0A4S4KA45_9AGAM|nr:hypothetical protein EW145_g8072 [Phellinidium pouzarii]
MSLSSKHNGSALRVKGLSASIDSLKKHVDDPTYPTPHDAPAREVFAFDAMQEALAGFARGEFLVVMDDESRENEGDLIISAAHCTTEKMAWMIKHTSGYICIALPGERLEELEIPMMVSDNQDRNKTAYTVTVDYRHA